MCECGCVSVGGWVVLFFLLLFFLFLFMHFILFYFISGGVGRGRTQSPRPKTLKSADQCQVRAARIRAGMPSRRAQNANSGSAPVCLHCRDVHQLFCLVHAGGVCGGAGSEGAACEPRQAVPCCRQPRKAGSRRCSLQFSPRNKSRVRRCQCAQQQAPVRTRHAALTRVENHGVDP